MNIVIMAPCAVPAATAIAIFAVLRFPKNRGHPQVVTYSGRCSPRDAIWQLVVPQELLGLENTGLFAPHLEKLALLELAPAQHF